MPPETPMERLEASDQAAIARGEFVRYHILAGKSFSVECADGTQAVVGAGWLAIREEEYAHLLAEIARLTADCARKDAALEPFARLATRTIYLRDDEPVWLHTAKGTFGQPPEHDITARHFRAAASARGEG